MAAALLDGNVKNDINLRVHGGNIGRRFECENQADNPTAVSAGTDRPGTHNNNSAKGPPNQQSSFEDIEARITSFGNLPQFRENARDLAKAGFYYCDQRNATRCFKCGVMIENWEDALKPMDEHTHQLQSCLFVRDMVRARHARDRQLVKSPGSNKRNKWYGKEECN